MDYSELKREQYKLARKVILRDSFNRIKTVGGAECIVVGDKLLASIIVCEFPSMKILEHKTYYLTGPLPFRPSFSSYREMPAIIDAYNLLDKEPDLLIVKGAGILHQRRLGVASHLGLALNIPTIGVQDKLSFGDVTNGKVLFRNEILGFEIKTKKFSNPIYVSPGHLISLGSVLNLIPKMMVHLHKKPEPLHLAHKMARKMIRGKNEEVITILKS